jgi:nuclear pore complex protein Nup107
MPPLVRDLFFNFSFFFWWLTLEQCFLADRRGRELGRIRQIFIPELILRLHGLLVSSRTHIPECVLRFPLTRASSWPTIVFFSLPLFSNVRHALLLANVVADSRYMLFTEFAGENGRRLKEYLAAVRTAVLAGLEHGGSDPFRAVL